MRGRLGIDFLAILLDFGCQVGKPNRAKRGPRGDLTGPGRPSQGQAKPRPSQDAAATSGQRPGSVQAASGQRLGGEEGFP